MKEKKETKKQKETSKIVEAKGECRDKDCPTHGYLKTHGRIFQGTVIKKHYKRLTIEFERSVYVRKYERFASYKTKIHARLPKCMDEKIQIGDYIRVQECRPLSKIIHFVVLGKAKKIEGVTE